MVRISRRGKLREEVSRPTEAPAATARRVESQRAHRRRHFQMLEVKFQKRPIQPVPVVDPPDRRKPTREVGTDGKTSKGRPKLSIPEIEKLMETNVKFRRRVARQTERSIKADELAVQRIKNLENSNLLGFSDIDNGAGEAWKAKTQRSIQEAYSKKAIPVLDIGADSVEQLQEMVAGLELKDSVRSQVACTHGHIPVQLVKTWVVFKPQQLDFDDYSNRRAPYFAVRKGRKTSVVTRKFDEERKTWTRLEDCRVETPCPQCLALKEMQKGLCPHQVLADGKVKGTSVETANVEWRSSGCDACKLVKKAYGERWVRK